MIPLNDRFSLKRDRYNWILVETYMGQDRDGKSKPQTRESYHPFPHSAVKHMCDLQGQDVGSWMELIGLYESARELLKADGEIAQALSLEVAALRSEVRQLRAAAA